MKAGLPDIIKMNKIFGKSLKLRKYNSLIETLQVTRSVKKFAGLSVFELASDPERGVVSKFSPSGLALFTAWSTLYYFTAYRSFSEDQTILRELYNTRLKQYGDVFERVVSILFVTYVMFKIPFHLNLSTEHIKMILDIDSSIESLGVKIDHSKDARDLLIVSFSQVVAGCMRLFSVWVTLSYLKITMPIEVLVQSSVTDVLALVTSAHYCHYISLLQKRYKIINDVLAEIKDRKSWEQRVFVRSRQPMNMPKVFEYQDKHVCNKIKAFAKIYGLLFKAVEASQRVFGFALVCTLLFCLLYVVLYLFYFMEATASGLFHDTQRYAYFFIYVFWQILYTVAIIFLNIYISESTVKEAGRTSFIVHEIINSDVSSPITAEAMQFSMQLLHQIPVFTACGLCRIDYMLLLQGAYNVATFLVILLQFVMI